MRSLDYEVFMEEEKKEPRTLYEKLCKAAEFLNIEPEKKDAESIQRMVDEAGIAITPKGAVSLASGVFLLWLIITVILLLLGLLSPIGIGVAEAVSLTIIDALVFIYLLNYPKKLYNEYRLKMKAGFIQAFMYMSIYLRDNPSLEGAIKYAAANTKPPVSVALKKLVWDLSSGRYTNLDEALEDFLEPWKNEREITQTFQILSTAINQPFERRVEMIDEAIRLLLANFREKSRTFNRSVRVPMLALNAFGMFLPVISMVMLPVVFIFLNEMITVPAVFMMYDVVLPLLLMFFIDEMIRAKPVTFEPPSIEAGVPIGRFMVFGIAVPAIVPAAAVFIGFCAASFIAWKSSEFFGAALFVSGLFMSAFTYSKLSIIGRESMYDKVKSMEEEFGISLFSLGNEISTGHSFEVAVKNALAGMKKLKIAEMFRTFIRNLESGMTVVEAISDDERGIFSKFRSDMIKNIMLTVVRSMGKGSKALSVLLIGISKYIKEIKEAERDVSEVLGEVTSSVKFQALVLNPILIGSLSSMTKLMLDIIKKINDVTNELSASSMAAQIPSFGNIKLTEGNFILITGTYLFESAILLAYFTSVIDSGFDRIFILRNTAKTLIISLIVYIIVLIGMGALFGGISIDMVV